MAMEIINNLEQGDIVREKINNNFKKLYAAIGNSDGGDLSIYELKTYGELYGLKSSDNLVPGMNYLLTDYITKYNMPVVNTVKETAIDYPANTRREKLVLKATSENTFSPVAYSVDYPNDIIYYNFDDNICEDGVTPRNGFIERRIDTVNNIDIPQDWRHMVWPRFKATAQTWTAGTSVTRHYMYQNGTSLYIAIKNGIPVSATDSNYFKSISNINQFFWDGLLNLEGLTCDLINYAERYTFNASVNLILATPTKNINYTPSDIVIMSDIYGEYDINDNYIFYDNLHNNVFMFSNNGNRPISIYAEHGFKNNRFLANCAYNHFAIKFNNNICGEGFRQNSCGNSISYNIFGYGSHSNTMGAEILGNKFLGGAALNIFENGVTGNISLGTFQYNRLGNDCDNNLFIGRTSSNSFATKCVDNIMGDYFDNNIIENLVGGRDMSSIVELHKKSYSHTIFRNSTLDVYAMHYVGTTPTFTAIP